MEEKHLSFLTDSFGRRIRKLRISLTDQCNFRCLYCVPEEGVPTLPKTHHLSNEALIRFARVAVRLGVSQIRLTGGEPLLRKNLVPLVQGLSVIPGLQDIGITTNGDRLKELARPLKEAGLTRINVSLDSLDADRFQAITRSSAFRRVLEGIEEALILEFPMKLNVVLLKGMNDSEILSFADLALNHPLEVRFLEFMPLCGSAWSSKRVYPVGEARRLIEERFFLREEERKDNPAQSFIVSDGNRRGRIGFIGPLSEPFCGSCSRIRLTVDGRIQPCLFSHQQSPIKPLLDQEVSDEELTAAIREAVWKKSRGSQYADLPYSQENMSSPQAYGGNENRNPLIHNLGG